MDLSTLNKEQLAAVRHTEGPLLLLAGAGSGKTRVITFRIAYLLRQLGVAPEQILAVTFTNKAAREMKERVRELVGRRESRDMAVSTFHSLGVRMLREDIEKLGYKKNFSIYGAADQARLVRDLIRASTTGGRKYDADRILWLISDAKNRLIPPEAFTAGPRDEYAALAAEVYPRYQRALKAFNAVDFDDILMLAVRLLRDDPKVLCPLAGALSLPHGRRVSGHQRRPVPPAAAACAAAPQPLRGRRRRPVDLRLARRRSRQHPRLRKGLSRRQGHQAGAELPLHGQYPGRRQRRDPPTTASARRRLCGPRAGPGSPIDYLRCEDEEDEARRGGRARSTPSGSATASNTATSPSSTAPTSQSRAFEEQLRYENIPYVLIGGQQFFDRKEVKDAVAYFKVLVNPRDEVNLLRILNYPRRGIGETTADRLIRYSAEKALPLWEVLQDPCGIEDLGQKALEATASFVALMEKYRFRFRRPGLLAETAREFLAEIGIEDEIYRGAEDPNRARRRVDNVDEVLNALASFAEREVRPTLAGFLEKVSLLDGNDSMRGSKEEKLTGDAVVLMSLHSSKGLEFPHVFLVGMEEGFLPHKKSVDETFDIDEERRLCYVGITRARRRLTLLGASRRRKYGRQELRIPSRFLEEIPRELLREQCSQEPAVTGPGEKEKLASNFFSGIRGLLGE